MAKTTKRTELNDRFINQLALDFEVHGEAVIEKLRLSDLRAYSNLVAALVPKRLEVESKTDAFDQMGADDVEEYLVRSFAQDIPQAERIMAKAKELAAKGDVVQIALPNDSSPTPRTKRKSRPIGLPIVQGQ